MIEIADLLTIKEMTMTKDELWQKLSRVNMSIEAQLALKTTSQFALSGQFSRRAKGNVEGRFIRREEFNKRNASIVKNPAEIWR